MAGFSEHGNEPLGSVKHGRFFDQLKNSLPSQEGPCSMELIGVQSPRRCVSGSCNPLQKRDFGIAK